MSNPLSGLALKARFDASYYMEPISGCWLWERKQWGRNGYGSIIDGGKCFSAHRVSWLLHNGEIPLGAYVCHRCDVRCCVNPTHLFLGTQKDNLDDAIRKGRARNPPVLHGAANSATKLTAIKAEEIRRRHASGELARVLAVQYVVTIKTIWDISKGRTWRSS